ncbi:hypothetical protein [Dongia sp.]|uniref:hypothetical protein n=1 Tax=Dongia sp. TaxID=1977262 RepID=UPI003752A249
MILIQRRFRSAGALALAAGLSLAASQAWAQAAASQPEPGPSIQAVDYAPIPAGSTFELQADDELSQDAIERVRSELANQGYAAQDQASLVMVIESDLIRGQKQDDPFGQVHADNDEAEVRARLFSTSQNSLLNPQQPIGSADRAYRINISIYDRSTGLYVWRGSAMRSDPNLDVTQAGNEMIGALIGAVGKTVTPAQP